MKIQPGTWIRTAVLLVTVANQLLTATGKNPLPFSEEELYQAFTAVATAVMSIVAWWNNNSFSEEAIAADQYMHTLKQTVKEEEHAEQ